MSMLIARYSTIVANEHREIAANLVVLFARSKLSVDITSLTESLFGFFVAGYSSIINKAA